MGTTTFNSEQEIQITSVYFRVNPDEHRLESYPRRMVLEGREYSFLESGIRQLVQKGQELVKLFDVSDGQTQYRLRLDGLGHWALINSKSTI